MNTVSRLKITVQIAKLEENIKKPTQIEHWDGLYIARYQEKTMEMINITIKEIKKFLNTTRSQSEYFTCP